jgi:hypothetical protein
MLLDFRLDWKQVFSDRETAELFPINDTRYVMLVVLVARSVMKNIL